MIRNNRRIAGRGLIAALAGLALLVGCGQQAAARADRATVGGTVTYSGKPLPGGAVSFISISNHQSRVTGVLEADGTFHIADVPIGAVHVVIDTEPMRFGAPQRFIKIPERYRNLKTSHLTYEVQPGENRDVLFRLE